MGKKQKTGCRVLGHRAVSAAPYLLPVTEVSQ